MFVYSAPCNEKNRKVCSLFCGKLFSRPGPDPGIPEEYIPLLIPLISMYLDWYSWKLRLCPALQHS